MKKNYWKYTCLCIFSSVACVVLKKKIKEQFEFRIFFTVCDIRWLLRNVSRTWKQQSALCFWGLNSQINREVCMSICLQAQQREENGWDSQSKLLMLPLVPGRHVDVLQLYTSMVSHTKLYNFGWCILLNNSHTGYRTALRLCYVFYL